MRYFLPMVIAVWLGTAPAASAQITVDLAYGPDRHVAGSASVDGGSSPSFNVSNGGGGPFSAAPAPITDSANGNTVTVSASQNSSIPNLTGPSMSGSGAAHETANITNAHGAIVANGSAESFFDIGFEVAVSQPYVLSGSFTAANGDGSSSAFVVSQFFDDTTGDQPFSLRQDTDGTTPFSVTLSLAAGDQYDLYIDAAAAPGFLFNPTSGPTNFDSSWTFDLSPVPVPEPSALALLGAAGLTAVGRRCGGGRSASR